MKTWWMGLLAMAIGLASCGGSDSPQQNADTTPVPGEATCRIVVPGLKSDNPAPPPPTPTPSPAPAPMNEPVGFPLDRDAATGIVTGTVGSRTIAWEMARRYWR